MLVVSSAMHVLAHYYNYERLIRYSARRNVPGGFQYNVPLNALPRNGSLGVSKLCYSVYCVNHYYYTGIQSYSNLFHDM